MEPSIATGVRWKTWLASHRFCPIVKVCSMKSTIAILAVSSVLALTQLQAKIPKGILFWRLSAPDGEIVFATTGTFGTGEPEDLMEYRLNSGKTVAFPVGSASKPLLSSDNHFLCDSGYIRIYDLPEVARSEEAKPAYEIVMEDAIPAPEPTEQEADARFRRFFDAHWLGRENEKPGKTYEEALSLAKTNPAISKEVEKAEAEARESMRQDSLEWHEIKFCPTGWLETHTVVACASDALDYGFLALKADLDTKVLTLYLTRSKNKALLKETDAKIAEKLRLSKTTPTQGWVLKFERGEFPAVIRESATDFDKHVEDESVEYLDWWIKLLDRYSKP